MSVVIEIRSKQVRVVLPEERQAQRLKSAGQIVACAIKQFLKTCPRR
jgi:hypothetical protein